MTTEQRVGATVASGAYTALRQGGAPPWLAQAQLGLRPKAAARLEILFQRRPGRSGADSVKPRFARHDEHVRQVLAAGGYPSLRERPR